MRRNADHVLPPSTTANGDVATNATTASETDNASARHRRHSTTASGTSSRTPDHFADTASPIASPASQNCPETSSASAIVVNVVSGTSVTAACENATCVDATAVTSAAIAPATVPYAREPSHHAAATPASASATTTSLPARYDGPPSHAWNGATRYVTSVGQSKKCGSRPPPCTIFQARGTTFCSSGSRSEPYGSPYWMPTSRSAAAPARIAPSATPGPPQLDGWRRATDELGDVSGGDDHGVDPTPLELDDLVASNVLRLRDRELPD